MDVFSAVIYTTLLAVVLGSSTSCPSGWISNDGTCYLFAHYPVPFNEAKLYCKQHNGHLVEVHNSGVNDFIKDHLRMLNTKHWWMGLTDEATEGAWEWQVRGDVANYTDWASRHEQGHANEDCSIFAYNYDFKWADYNCATSVAPICEMSGYTCIPETEIVG